MMSRYDIRLDTGMPILSEGWGVFEDDLSTYPPKSTLIAVFDSQSLAKDECKSRYFEWLDRDHTHRFEGGGSALIIPNRGRARYEFNMARVVLKSAITVANYEEQLTREIGE